MCQKTDLKSRWTVPLKISYTITWLAIVQKGHEFASLSASALRFFSESVSAFFYADPQHCSMRIQNVSEISQCAF